MLIAGVLLLQTALLVLLIAKYPQSTAATLRAAAELIDAAAAARGAALSEPGPRTRKVFARRMANRGKTRKTAARELEAPSEKIENDLIRALVRLGSSESAARLHVIGLMQQSLIRPDMAIEQALAIAFQQLRPKALS